MTKVKICGLTNDEDARTCALLGADMIGCIVDIGVETPREVSAERAMDIFSALPHHVDTVVVTAASSASKVMEVIGATGASAVQLHGKEDLELVKKVSSESGGKVIKTVHVTGKESIEEAERFARHCYALLLETPSKGLGGSGRTHNWKVSKRIVEAVDVPIFLSGGLRPENVGKAIREVRPYAVDVSSGVEAGPGIKDYIGVANFIREVRGGCS